MITLLLHSECEQESYVCTKLHAYAQNRYSQRIKFVFVPWCGENVGIMRKAKLSIQIADVKNVVRNFHIEVPASHTSDLTESEIMTKLRRAGGANYDRQSSNY